MSDPTPLKFTERETELLAATWRCFEGGFPKVNFPQLAAMTGYTEGSAKYALGQLKTKLKKHNEAISNGNGNGNGSGNIKINGNNTGKTSAKTLKTTKQTSTKPASSRGKRKSDEAALDTYDEVYVKKQATVEYPSSGTHEDVIDEINDTPVIKDEPLV
ncbi:unnamed protein product [Periconia digitata]|uniref:Uncharacterized protein n=1 Tax=Periconia digitata TaxID=1303443 RepID=A0A9W4UIM1_9PLEO|nr:unnamed protein product [Periconia digitata]